MTLRIAIQMDPVETLNVEADSSFVLVLEAQKRGYVVYYYKPEELSLLDGRVLARARRLTLQPIKGDHFTCGEEVILNLKEDIDIILMRQDPPFNLAYITATHILDHLYPSTLVFNDPFEVRNAPEKLLCTHFRGLTPPTLISADETAIRSFYEEHRNIVLKPLYEFGGSQVFHVDEKSDNLGSLLLMYRTFYKKEPIVAQKYLPEAKEGDKRIVLVEGQPVGAYFRVPAAGEVRAGFHAGGSAKPADLSARDLDICAAVGPELAKRGIVFAGLDVIGGFLTEINVTSPGGIPRLNSLANDCIEAKIWDAIEVRFQRHKVSI